ncbi:MAG: hypothetical protein H7196_02635 [candidate division SR1 bacterium]|nr:hypothetical protein [candidate division SR1 bacterium]
MKLANVISLSVIVFASTIFANVKSSFAGESCDSGKCVPAPIYNSGGGNASSVPASTSTQSSNNSNSGIFTNLAGNSVATSNSFNVGGGNISPAMFSVSGICSGPRDSEGWFIGASVNGSTGQGYNTGSPISAGATIAYTTNSYRGVGKFNDDCNKALEIAVLQKRVEFCTSIIAFAQKSNLRVNFKKLAPGTSEICEAFTPETVVVVPLPAPTAPVVQPEPIYAPPVPKTGTVTRF